MSHWKDVACDLKCSIDVMKRSLLRINPEWERHLEVSQEGSLKIDNQYTGEAQKGGFHIRVKGARGNGARDLPYADMGLKKNGDGTWSITVDPVGGNYIRQLPDHVKAQVAQLRTLQQAMINGDTVISQDYDRNDGMTTTVIEIDTDNLEGIIS